MKIRNHKAREMWFIKGDSQYVITEKPKLAASHLFKTLKAESLKS